MREIKYTKAQSECVYGNKRRKDVCQQELEIIPIDSLQRCSRDEFYARIDVKIKFSLLNLWRIRRTDTNVRLTECRNVDVPNWIYFVKLSRSMFCI